MRVSNWNPQKYDSEFLGVVMDRLRKAAEVIADEARERCPVGTITRPIYKSGPYAGQAWTKRDGGSLKRSIRVVEKTGIPSGIGSFAMAESRNIRIYAGNYFAYYAKIVEFAGKKFFRPALNASKGRVRQILENG
jgi:hypothetical protein